MRTLVSAQRLWDGQVTDGCRQPQHQVLEGIARGHMQIWPLSTPRVTSPQAGVLAAGSYSTSCWRAAQKVVVQGRA